MGSDNGKAVVDVRPVGIRRRDGGREAKATIARQCEAGDAADRKARALPRGSRGIPTGDDHVLIGTCIDRDRGSDDRLIDLVDVTLRTVDVDTNIAVGAANALEVVAIRKTA